jgi:branched-chain amino acid transport system ATP-binding protein
VDQAAVSSAPAILSCENLHKKYGALVAIDGLSFSVRQGEVFGIGGPNGAGKTTLFDVISGLSAATGGRVMLESNDITTLSPNRICRLGVARTFQLNAVFESLTLRENVETAAYFGHSGRRFLGLSRDGAARQRAAEALEFVGLGNRADRPIAQASVLERKLLMVASALATAPKVILLDEPVGGLTPPEIDQFIALVRRLLERGTSIVIIEHVMRFLLTLSSRVMIMHQGRKLFEGAPQAVVEDAQIRRVYLGETTAARLNQFFSPTVAPHG